MSHSPYRCYFMYKGKKEVNNKTIKVIICKSIIYVLKSLKKILKKVLAKYCS